MAFSLRQYWLRTVPMAGKLPIHAKDPSTHRCMKVAHEKMSRTPLCVTTPASLLRYTRFSARIVFGDARSMKGLKMPYHGSGSDRFTSASTLGATKTRDQFANELAMNMT